MALLTMFFFWRLPTLFWVPYSKYLIYIIILHDFGDGTKISHKENFTWIKINSTLFQNTWNLKSVINTFTLSISFSSLASSVLFSQLSLCLQLQVFSLCIGPKNIRYSTDANDQHLAITLSTQPCINWFIWALHFTQ